MNAYELNFAISYFFTGIILLILAVIVLSRNPKNRINLTFSVYSIAISWWSMFSVLMITSDSYEAAFFWDKVCLLGVVFIPTTFIHFTYAFLRFEKKYIKRIRFLYLLSVFFLISIYSPYFLKGMAPAYKLKHFTRPNVGYFMFLIYYTVSVIYGIILLHKGKRKAKGIKIVQLTYLFWATLFGYLGGALNYNLVLGIPPFEIVPYGNYCIGIYGLAVAYTIIKYRLMDIRLAITKASIFIFVYSFVLGIPFILAFGCQNIFISFFGDYWWVIPLFCFTIFTTAGPFIYLFLQKKAEERILKEEIRTQELLIKASYEMTTIRNLKKLLEFIIDVLTKGLMLDNAAIYFKEIKEELFILKVSKSEYKNHIEISSDGPLVKRLESKKVPLIYEETKMFFEGQSDDANLREIVKQMKELSASVIIPAIAENILIGFIILGERKDRGVYSSDLINALSVLGNQAALAIENAMFVEESEKDLAQRSHESRLKAIGAMGSGVAHQIRNRLNIPSGLASSFLSKLEKIDLEHASKEELCEMLLREKKSMTKILDNTIQCDKICVAINSYSKLSNEKEAVEIGSIIEMVITIARGRIDFKMFELKADYPENAKIFGVVPMLQDIFVNLLVNARDAMQTKINLIENGEWDILNYKPKVKIKCRVKRDKLIVDFTDNGTGFKPENEKNAFVPFYTTKGTGIKGKDGGTGLGLHLIWDFIKKNDGNLELINKYKEGTTFRLTLPLEKAERKS